MYNQKHEYNFKQFTDPEIKVWTVKPKDELPPPDPSINYMEPEHLHP